MRKLFALLFVACMFSVVACSDEAKQEATADVEVADTTTVAEEVPVAEEVTEETSEEAPAE